MTLVHRDQTVSYLKVWGILIPGDHSTLWENRNCCLQIPSSLWDLTDGILGPAGGQCLDDRRWPYWKPAGKQYGNKGFTGQRFLVFEMIVLANNHSRGNSALTRKATILSSVTRAGVWPKKSEGSIMYGLHITQFQHGMSTPLTANDTVLRISLLTRKEWNIPGLLGQSKSGIHYLLCSRSYLGIP